MPEALLDTTGKLDNARSPLPPSPHFISQKWPWIKHLDTHGSRAMPEALLDTSGKLDNVRGPLQGSTYHGSRSIPEAFLDTTREARQCERPTARI